jgi:iron(III) transport system substrate-binding protein
MVRHFIAGRRLGRLIAVASIAIVIGGTAACGGPAGAQASKANDKFNGMTLDQLYQGAKKEGAVVLYSALSDDDLKTISAGFDKEYPGIKIEHFQEQGEDSASKMSEEARAGVYKADVLDTDQNTMYAVGQAGLLAKYNAPVATNVDPRLKQTYFTGYRIQVKPISYNTKIISAADAPTGYTDLLDPKYDNKLCAEASEVSVFADMLQQMGQDQGTQFWKTLHQHGLRFVDGQTNLVQSLVSGDCPIAVSANVHTVAKDIAKGAPLAWVKTDPLYANYDGVGVAAKAPHPYAARLWVNYVLSETGQQAIANAYRVPANKSVQPKEPELQNNNYTLVLAGDTVMTNFTKLNNLWYTTTGRPVVGG